MFSKAIEREIVEEASAHVQRWRNCQANQGAPGKTQVVDEETRRLRRAWNLPQLALALAFSGLGLGLIGTVLTYGHFGLVFAGWAAVATVFITPFVLLWIFGLRLRDLFPFGIIFRL